jgi:hypothetical protein
MVKQTKKNKTKTNLEICAPGIKQSFTCFSKKDLITIINSWNNNNSNDKIIYNKNNSKLSLWNKIDKKLNNICNDEYCWVKTTKVMSKSFKPKKPVSWIDNPKTWLNTTDINNVLSQYENKYLDFKYMGAHPIDFDYKFLSGNCVVNNICNIDVNKFFNKDVTRLGFVFNLDKHYQSGSHWVAMFCDLKNGKIYYYDSVGVKPPNEIINLTNRINKQLNLLNIKCKFYYNKKQHQYYDSECGIFSIYFILSMLKGTKFNYIVNNGKNDLFMFNKRSELFI